MIFASLMFKVQCDCRRGKAFYTSLEEEHNFINVCKSIKQLFIKFVTSAKVACYLYSMTHKDFTFSVTKNHPHGDIFTWSPSLFKDSGLGSLGEEVSIGSIFKPPPGPPGSHTAGVPTFKHNENNI